MHLSQWRKFGENLLNGLAIWRGLVGLVLASQQSTAPTLQGHENDPAEDYHSDDRSFPSLAPLPT
jgi:hypothetical protein